jgi:hypothetical protein
MQMRAIAVTALLLIMSLGLSDSAWSQRPSQPPAPGALESPIGRVISVSGSVTVERTATVVAQAAVVDGVIKLRDGDLVYRGDTIQTGADSKASLTFADGTAFNINSNARMALNEYVYNADSQSNSSLFSLLKGTFTFVAGKIAKTGSMKVDTPVATMGIRGTTPHVVVSEDGTVTFSTLVEEKR